MTYTFKGTDLSALFQEDPLTVEALFLLWRVVAAPSKCQDLGLLNQLLLLKGRSHNILFIKYLKTTSLVFPFLHTNRS